MKRRGKRWTLGVALLLAITVMATGCNLLGLGQGESPTDTPTAETEPTPTQMVEETPSPTAEPTATSAPPTPVPPTATPSPTQVDPTVAISPTSGPPGTELTVSATGFQPGTAVEIGIGPAESEYDVTGTAETDAEGRVGAMVAVPELAEDGQRWVVVVAVIGQPVDAVSNPFAVTSAAGAPTVVVAPRAGAPGTPVTVRAEGFAPQAMVDIGFGRVDSEYDVLETVQTDAAGNLTTEVVVPDFAEPEDIWVFVVANTQTGAKAASSPFDVTSGMPVPTETPIAGGFTRANIYLIAVDDGGASGQLIGCNDSVVPVEVTFEPTVAPLRAALNELLAIDEQFYGGSGLYNALYQSDLSAGAINIVQGTATIALSGNLVLGGACDAPRVEAQIEQTALQFSTVQNVQVTLNGQPLEDVLSGQ